MERLTDGLTSTTNNFSTETINVRLSSPEVPDLTVVDLPGIIRTSTAGQNPAVIAQVGMRVPERSLYLLSPSLPRRRCCRCNRFVFMVGLDSASRRL